MNQNQTEFQGDVGPGAVKGGPPGKKFQGERHLFCHWEGGKEEGTTVTREKATRMATRKRIWWPFRRETGIGGGPSADSKII